MKPKTIAAFGLIYALLFLVAIGSGLGAYAALTMSSKVSVHALGESRTTIVARAYLEKIAAQNGLRIRSQKVVSSSTHGARAEVTIALVLSDGEKFKVRVRMSKSLWNIEGSDVIK